MRLKIQFWAKDGAILHASGLNMVCCLKDSDSLVLFQQILHLVHVKTCRITYLYGAGSDKYAANDLLVCNMAQMMASIISQGTNISSFTWTARMTRYEIINPHCLSLLKQFFPHGANPKYLNPVHPDLSKPKQETHHVHVLLDHHGVHRLRQHPQATRVARPVLREAL